MDRWLDSQIYQAERHLASAQHIVAAQLARVESLRRAGADTLAAEQALAIFEKNLDIFQDHFDQLVVNQQSGIGDQVSVISDQNFLRDT